MRLTGKKVECNACPVLCQISEGRTGACDRYGNFQGVLTRVDPVVLFQKVTTTSGAVTEFLDGEQLERQRLLPMRLCFVSGVGSGTTYPDYKPAPFIVSSQHQGVDMVTVVTEGIFSYCSFKIKIDTDRWLGPEQATVRCERRGGWSRDDRGVRFADAFAGRRAPPDRRQQEGRTRYLRSDDGAG